MKGITIVICCYNSSKRLPKTLKYISNQKMSIDWELIIIDNNSSDDTRSIAINEWKKNGQSSTNLKIINEEKIGLNNARLKGILCATYNYVILCDDDNWLEENYCERAFKIMESNPEIGLLGGRSEAEFDTPPPFWFNTYQKEYAVGVQSFTTGDISKRGYLWGAGMVIRKSIFIKLINVGFKFLLSDRKGESLASGGDAEISKWFLIAGYKLWYDENLYFKHYITEKRLDKNYLVKLFEGLESSMPIINKYDYFIKNNHIKYGIISALKIIFYSAKYLIRNDRYAKMIIDFNLPIYLKFFISEDVLQIRRSKNIFFKNEKLS